MKSLLKSMTKGNELSPFFKDVLAVKLRLTAYECSIATALLETLINGIDMGEDRYAIYTIFTQFSRTEEFWLDWLTDDSEMSNSKTEEVMNTEFNFVLLTTKSYYNPLLFKKYKELLTSENMEQLLNILFPEYEK